MTSSKARPRRRSSVSVFELPRDIVRMLGPGLFGHPGDGEQQTDSPIPAHSPLIGARAQSQLANA